MSQFCLKWNNHVSNMLTMFENLKSMEDFVDVTLACEGHLIKAHKLILSAGSKFFHNLFITNPCKHPIIVLHDIKYNILKAIIEFMYKGKIYVTHDHLQVLLKTAKTLDVKGLAEICKDSNRTENPDSQETSHPSTAMSSMTVPPESPPPSHKKKRIRLRKRSFDSTFSNDEIVPKIEEASSPEIQEPIDFVSNIGDSSNLLPNNILTIPRPIKRLSSSSSKPVSGPVCEELEVDPVTDHDYNVESLKEEQTSLTSEQLETSSKHSGEPVIHNISSSESVPISVVPPSDTLSSVRILDQNDSEGLTCVLECISCQAAFSSALELAKHIRMCHKTGNPLRYQCGECFYSCDKSDHFKRHIMTHTGERPHLCPFCNRRFTDKSNFNRHVRIHTRDKNLCF